MSKYITSFQQTGHSILDVELVCKDWNERFLICTWINENEEDYTFVVKGKRKNSCKTRISKEQATEIVLRLKLVHVKDSLLRSAGTYRTIDFIKSELERITEIKQEKEKELAVINDVLLMYRRCI
jgi:hypothetical protein